MIIGIYGTLGSGKTTIAKTFRQIGFKLIECDLIAKTIVNNLQVQKTIKKVFPQCFDDDVLNRKRLRTLISNSEVERLKLNKIIWPEIKNELIFIITNHPGNYVIDGALLPDLELKIDKYIHVKTAFLTSACRISKRDRKSFKETWAIFKKQKRIIKQYQGLSEVVIHNNFWNAPISIRKCKLIAEAN